MKKIGYLLGAGAFLLVLVLLVLYRESVSKGIYQAISYSLSVLIPSLMPFMFVSGLFSITPPSRVLCRLFAPLGKYLFRLSPAAAPAVLFGLTCGYPVGAKLTAELLSQGRITKNEAARLLVFTMNPGIPFCVLFLGGTVLRNPAAGLALYLSITAAGLITGVALGLFSKFTPPSAAGGRRDFPSLISAIKQSSDSTVRACLNMSFYIVVFWGFMALFHESGAFGAVVRCLPLPFADGMTRAGLLSFFFEVTGGISDSVSLGLPAPIFLLGLSFGGVCIHLQLFSFFKLPPLGYGRFLLGRLLQCALSLGVFSLIHSLFPQAFEASVLVGNPVFGGLKGNFVGSLCLTILFITYILISEKESKESVEKKPKK